MSGPGLHVAMIMDGNGRWAKARGLPRVAGHRLGAETLRAVVEAAPALGITTLSAYAFSSDNWKRPPDEVSALFGLFESYVSHEIDAMVDADVRLSVIGRRDRLPRSVVAHIEDAEATTAPGTGLHLRLAIDYSARDAITQAAIASAVDGPISTQRIGARVGSGRGQFAPVPDVDLLIRTGGEQRLSDFLLWECAYAELWFTQTMWPEFSPTEFARAVQEFSRRERRFGAVPV